MRAARIPRERRRDASHRLILFQSLSLSLSVAVRLFYRPFREGWYVATPEKQCAKVISAEQGKSKDEVLLTLQVSLRERAVFSGR